MKVVLGDKIAFEIFGTHRENIELKVSSGSQEIVVKLCADSLLELVTDLTKAAESVV